MNKIQQLQFIQDNYPAYTNHISSRKLRHNFFKNIQIEIQAYLLGFYVADGSVDQKRKTLRVHIQERDSYIVNLFKDFISPDARTFHKAKGKTTGRNGKQINANPSYGLDITSSILVEDLVNMGYGYQKSYSEFELPNLSDKLLLHFIRGLFDGDGSFTAYIRIDQGKSPRKAITWSIVSKTKSILESIQKFLLKYDISLTINYLKRDDMYRLQTSSIKTLEKIFHLLYDNANFYLIRKFDKINYYVNTEVNQIITDHCNAQEMSVNESNNSPTSPEHPTQDENIC